MGRAMIQPSIAPFVLLCTCLSATFLAVKPEHQDEYQHSNSACSAKLHWSDPASHANYCISSLFSDGALFSSMRAEHSTEVGPTEFRYDARRTTHGARPSACVQQHPPLNTHTHSSHCLPQAHTHSHTFP